MIRFVYNPLPRAAATRPARSGRSSGSPPERRAWSTPRLAASSKTRRHSSLESSSVDAAVLRRDWSNTGSPAGSGGSAPRAGRAGAGRFPSRGHHSAGLAGAANCMSRRAHRELSEVENIGDRISAQVRVGLGQDRDDLIDLR